MVENRFLREALFARLKELPSITVMMPNRIKDKTIDDYGVHLTLAGGETFRCALLVAAEGRTSSLRHDAGIEVMAWNYPQTAIVATLGHEYPHHEIALETFLPAGPFAVLPLAGGCRSSIVWTERDRLAKDYLALSESAFAAEIRRRVGDHLGRLEVLGSRFSHPVGLSLAKQIAAQRLALIGDAAHAIHPIAGQGLNLALRGIASLAEIVVETARLGLDLGSPEVLHRYETSRRADTLALALVTDGLNRLFSTDRAPLRLLRDLGMGAVNQTPFLKRIFMRHAMGMRDGMTRAALGELPRLIRGEAL
ncbi:MAG: FAD-dependent monooxygenase [Alphaproteobacteria bacterium]